MPPPPPKARHGAPPATRREHAGANSSAAAAAPRLPAAKKPVKPAAPSAAAAPPPPPPSDVLRFRGCRQFRQRLVLATLAGRRVRIDGIRDRDPEAPGMRDYEASFLRLLDKLTNGCRIEINETGTSLRYAPGVIVGGPVEHDCGTGRAVGWFVEGVLPLLPFAKRPTTAALTGITNDDADLSVDTLRTVTLPSLAHFGLGDGLALTLKRRGAPPAGGGLAVLTCPVVRELTPVNLCDEGYVRRVRGLAYSARVNPGLATRAGEPPRALLAPLLPDVYIFTDHYKGPSAGASPGYGLTLTAQSTSGCFYGAQRCTGVAPGLAAEPLYAASAAGGPLTTPPEDLGASACAALLEEVSRGGCIDTATQPLFLTLMALTPPDVSRVRLGALGPAGVDTLRLLKQVLGITFRLKTETADPAALAAAAVVELAAKEAAAKARLAANKAAAAPSAGGKRGRDDGDEEGGKGRGSINKRKRRETAEAGGGDDDDDEDGAGGESDGDAAAAAQPLTAAVTGGRSARSILVTCLGTGMKNVYKKVT